MSSLSYLKSKEIGEPSCKIEDLIENSEDLILLTGNYRGFFGRLFNSNNLKDFNNIINLLNNHFLDRIYFEIQRHNEIEEKNFERYILSNSKLLNIPLIATQEVYYLNKEMYDAHDALTCIGEKNFIDDKNRFKFSDHHYLKSHDELVSLYTDIPEALENNYNFHSRFNFKPKNQNQYSLQLLVEKILQRMNYQGLPKKV